MSFKPTSALPIQTKIVATIIVNKLNTKSLEVIFNSM